MGDRLPPELPTRLETERLILRPYALGEGPWYFRALQRNLDHLNGTAILVRPKDEDDAEVQLRRWLVDWISGKRYVFGIWDQESGAFVGETRLNGVDAKLPEYDLEGFVDHAFEGQGRYSEAARARIAFAFDHLGAHRLRAKVFCDNARSIRVLERLGFLREATLREGGRKTDGTRVDVHVYALLRSDYEASRE